MKLFLRQHLTSCSFVYEIHYLHFTMNETVERIPTEKYSIAQKPLQSEPLVSDKAQRLRSTYKAVRNHSEYICKPLKTEDYVVQPVVDVSPPKWHLGHTTWFWEEFVLKPNDENYEQFNPNYNYVFNSYYEAAGARVIRTD